MKHILATALVGLAILFASSTEAAGPDSRDTDRQEITAFMTALEETWNKHDMHAHAALFHEDAVWIAWTGQVLKGRAEYEDVLTRSHKTIYKNSVHKERIEELTFIAPDVAVVRGYGTVIGNLPTPEKLERYRILFVMTKRDGVWKASWGQKTRFLDSTPDPYQGK